MNTRCIFLCLSVLAILGCKEKEVPTIPVKSVTVSPAEKTIHLGEMVQLEVVISPSNATNQKIVWSSDTPGVAAVSDEGTVTGVSLGWTAIYAAVDGIKGYCRVTVAPREVESVTVEPASLTLEVGQSETLTATVSPGNADDKTVIWRSSDTDVATVEDGVVTAIAEGTATITASAGGKTASCEVTVPHVFVHVGSITLDKTETTIEAGATETLTAKVLPDNADNPIVAWSSSKEAVAVVEEGVVTAVSEGTATITATADGKSATCLVTVIRTPVDDGIIDGGIEGLTEDEEVDMSPKHHRVGILGDSISTFAGVLCNSAYGPFYPNDDPNVGVNPDLAVDCKEKTWWWRLIYGYMPNAELDANSSWGGTRVVHEVKKDIGAGFVDRAYDFVNPDIIIIHGGTNDKNQSTPLGEYDWDAPVGEGDLSCFRSAYVQLVKMLQERYEGVQLILLIGDTLTSGYENSIIEIARHFGLPYVDFVGVSIPKCKGSHPTAQGMSIMAERIYNTCKDYLQ